MHHLWIFHCITFRGILLSTLAHRFPCALWNPCSWSLGVTFTGLEDAVDDGTVELPGRLVDTKFLTGFDFGDDSFLVFTFLWSLAPFVIRHVWNVLWSKCLRVGSWSRHTWSEFVGSRFILSNNQSRATLWVLETWKHVSEWDFYLWWSSWSQLRCLQRCTTLLHYEKNSRLRKQNQLSTIQNAPETAACFTVCSLESQVSLCFAWILFFVWVRVQQLHNQIPDIKSVNSVHARTCIERNIFWFRRAVWHTCLFLAHPTYGNECVASKYAQCPTWSRHWIFKISCKVRVLKQSQTTWLCCIYHMSILFVLTREMNVRDQTCQTFVTSSGHSVIECASLLNDQRISGLPVRAKYRHVRTIWGHTSDNSPTDFNSPQ